MSKVLCVITGMGSGGAERQLVGLTKMLMDNGHEVEVVWYSKLDFYKSQLVEYGIPYKELYANGIVAKIVNIAQEVKRYKPDTVISFLTGPNTITPLLKMVGFRYHLIVSDRNTLQCLNLKYKLCFFLFKWADVIVPNSYSESKFISTHYPQFSKKLRVITNFTNTDYFCPRTEVKLPKNVTEFIIVARVDEQKNVKRFLKAVALLKERNAHVKFRWFGNSFKAEYRDECIQMINDLKVADYISIHPSTKQILKEYQSADAFCLPSLYEGFPNVVCEAMSCGLPVLCSNVCDNPNIVENGVNGYLFDPNNEIDIADTIEKFMKDMLPKADKIAKLNRDKIQHLCSPKAFVQKYLDIIK